MFLLLFKISLLITKNELIIFDLSYHFQLNFLIIIFDSYFNYGELGCYFLMCLIFLLLIILDRPPCPDGMLIVGWWSSSPQKEAKETLESVPIELCFYSRPVVFYPLLVPALPSSPSPLPSSHVSVLLS